MKIFLLFFGLLVSFITGAQNEQPYFNADGKWMLFHADSSPVVNPDTFNFRQLMINLQPSGRTITSYDTWDTTHIHEVSYNSNTYKIVTYQQLYKSVPVESGIYTASFINNQLASVNGNFLSGINMSVIASINTDSALHVGLNQLNFSEYVWDTLHTPYANYWATQDSLVLSDIVLNADTIIDSLNVEHVLNDSIYYFAPFRSEPDAELVIIADTADTTFIAGNARLAFKYNIWARIPDTSLTVYVDANDGGILAIIDNGRDEHGTHTTETGTVDGEEYYYDANMPFTTRWDSDLFLSKYSLHDDTRNIHTYEKFLGNEVRDYNNHWQKKADRQEALAHWGAQKTYDYYKNIHGRTYLYGNPSRPIRIVGNAKKYKDEEELKLLKACSATFFKYDQVIRMSGDNDDIKCSIEIADLGTIAHELFHGVMNYTVGGFENLNSSVEPRAISEGLSDISSAIVTYYVLGSADWSGEDYWISPWYRPMNNPNIVSDPSGQLLPTGITEYPLGGGPLPSYYKQSTHWDFYLNSFTSHRNSSVLSHWFYLLSVGGNSPSPGGPAITGISIEKAAKIFYLASLTKLHKYATYFDCRNAMANAAIELFGPCSFEVEQVIKAWDAVNVKDPNGNSILFDKVVDCNNVKNNYWVVGELSASCDISSGTGHYEWVSAKSIKLLPGFKSNNNFRASIEPCDYELQRRTVERSYAGKGWTPSLIIEKSEPDRKKPEYERNLVVYPNPTTGQFSFENNHIQPADVIVYDVFGRNLFSILNVEGKITIDLASYSEGLYLVQIRHNNKTYSHSIVHQK